MYVRVVVPLYPPMSFVGSWLTTHEFMLDLVRRGHDVSVTAYLSRFKNWDITYDGIPVQGHFRAVGSPDVVIGHAGDDGSAAQVCKDTGAPLVVMVHGGDEGLIRERLSGAMPRGGVGPPASLAVFNSESFREIIAWKGRSIVAHPPVDKAKYATLRGDHITLVNISDRKGGGTFWRLAEAMPDQKFLGVWGNYGDQVAPVTPPNNVVIQMPTENMRDDVYAKTKILLMPSDKETWGRVGVEAACSGIPTIAHPTTGVKESLGDCAIYANRDDLDEWIAAIRYLEDPVNYRIASARAQRPLKWHRARISLNRFAKAIDRICEPSS